MQSEPQTKTQRLDGCDIGAYHWLAGLKMNLLQLCITDVLSCIEIP